MGNTDLSYDITSAREKLGNATRAISSVAHNLTNAANSFAGVAERIDEKMKEFEGREAKVREMENEIKNKLLAVEKREEEVQRREEKLEEREKRQEEKEGKWEEMEKRVARNTANVGPLVHMNVRGTRFSAAKTDLIRFKESYFYVMLSNDAHNPNEEFFINQEPDLFKSVLSYLRTGQLQNSIEFDSVDLAKNFAFYNIPFPVFPFTMLLALEDGEDPKMNFEWQSTMMTWLPAKKFELIYKAARDGFLAENFHAACDEKGPTLTLIQSSEGYLFGGYSPISWDDSKGFETHSDCFLFTFTNPHSIPPTRYMIQSDDEEGICCNQFHCMTFGGGFDIVVSSNSNQANSLSYINFPTSYVDTTRRDRSTFTGTCQFTTKDIEVYSVVQLTF